MDELIYSKEEKEAVTVMTNPGDEDSGHQRSMATTDEVVTNSHASRNYSRSLSHISETSADGIVLTDKPAGMSGEVMSLTSGLSHSETEMEIRRTPEPLISTATDTDLSPRRLSVSKQNTSADMDQHQNRKIHETSSSVLVSSPDRNEEVSSSAPAQMNTHLQQGCSMLPESRDVTYVAHRVTVEEEVPGAEADERDDLVDSGLEEALGAVVSSLDDYRGQFPELQILEHELKLLQVTLKVRIERVKVAVVC